MYRIVVRFSHAGIIAHELFGDTLKAAVAKASRFKSEGFYVEIIDADDNEVVFTRHYR